MYVSLLLARQGASGVFDYVVAKLIRLDVVSEDAGIADGA